MSTTQHPRSIEKTLRKGKTARVVGTEIYLNGESVGNIGWATDGEGGTSWRVLIFAHVYPNRFPRAELDAAQDYALSLFS